MVNVAQYQIVATGSSVPACEQSYVRMLADKGVTQPQQRPETQSHGSIEEIRSAVLDGTTYYFLRLRSEEAFYAVSAAENRTAVTLNPGDEVIIDHAPPSEEAESAILDGYRFTLIRRAAPQAPAPEEPLPAAESETSEEASPKPAGETP